MSRFQSSSVSPTSSPQGSTISMTLSSIPLIDSTTLASCRFHDCPCPEYEPSSSSDMTATSNEPSTSNSWLSSSCDTCDHLTAWHFKPTKLSSAQAKLIKFERGEALEHCKARKKIGEHCRCPRFFFGELAGSSPKEKAVKDCALCECKKGWHKYKEPDPGETDCIASSNAELCAQRNLQATSAPLAALPSSSTSFPFLTSTNVPSNSNSILAAALHPVTPDSSTSQSSSIHTPVSSLPSSASRDTSLLGLDAEDEENRDRIPFSAKGKAVLRSRSPSITRSDVEVHRRYEEQNEEVYADAAVTNAFEENPWDGKENRAEIELPIQPAPLGPCEDDASDQEHHQSNSSYRPADVNHITVLDPSIVIAPGPPHRALSAREALELEGFKTAQRLAKEEYEAEEFTQQAQLARLISELPPSVMVFQESDENRSLSSSAFPYDEGPPSLVSAEGSQMGSISQDRDTLSTNSSSTSTSFGIAVGHPQEAGIYRSKHMALAVVPPIASGAIWKPGQTFDMRLKLDDAVAKADYDQLECRIVGKIAIKGAKSSAHECAISRVSIWPVRSSIVKIERSDERCFSWPMSIPNEPTCVCRPKRAVPCTFSHSDFFVDWTLELVARREGRFGGKGEKLVLHFDVGNVAVPRPIAPFTLENQEFTTIETNGPWNVAHQYGTEYLIEYTASILREPKFEYQLVLAPPISSDTIGKTASPPALRIIYRLSASVTSPPHSCFDPVVLVPLNSSLSVQLLQGARVNEPNSGASELDLSFKPVRQRLEKTETNNPVIIDEMTDRKKWLCEGYIDVPMSELKVLDCCSARIAYDLKVHIPPRSGFKVTAISIAAGHQGRAIEDGFDLRLRNVDLSLPDNLVYSRLNDAKVKPAKLITSKGSFDHALASTPKSPSSPQTAPTSPISPSPSASRRGSLFSRLRSMSNGVLTSSVAEEPLDTPPPSPPRVLRRRPSSVNENPSPNRLSRSTSHGTTGSPASSPRTTVYSPRTNSFSSPSTRRSVVREETVDAEGLPTFESLSTSEEGTAPPPSFEEAVDGDVRYQWERIVDRLDRI